MECRSDFEDHFFHLFNCQSGINLTHTHISCVSLQGTVQFLTYTIQVIFPPYLL